jgi:lipopolysaccharide transport system permease protein
MESTFTFGSARSSLLESLRELYRFRVLLVTLVSRQLKARYRGSLLGFLWTILNPLLLMAVYALVFKYYMRFAVENYTAFLLCGILAWTYFASSLSEGTNSILSGGSLITKSLFPPQVLPTVTVLSQLVNYLLSLPILVVFLFWNGIPLHATLLALPVLLLLQTIFTWGMVLGLAALNVHFRDIQHILGNVLLLWFFLSPVIYPADQVPEAFAFILYLNPVGLMIEAYHGIFLHGTLPSAGAWLGMIAFSGAAAFLGIRIFEHYRETFPELV